MMEGRVSPSGVLGLRRVGARGLQIWELASGDWELPSLKLQTWNFQLLTSGRCGGRVGDFMRCGQNMDVGGAVGERAGRAFLCVLRDAQDSMDGSGVR